MALRVFYGQETERITSKLSGDSQSPISHDFYIRFSGF